MSEPLTKEKLAQYVAAVQRFDTLARENLMHGQIVATVQDLERQHTEQTAALAVLAEALNTFGQHSRFCELELFGWGLGTCDCGLIAALSPDAVQQAVAEHRKALAVVERVLDIDLIIRALDNRMDFDATDAILAEAVQKALLGEEAQAPGPLPDLSDIIDGGHGQGQGVKP